MKYTAVSVVKLPAGATLVLTEAQANARKHALEPVPRAKGRYTTTAPVQFKAGEVFVYEGDLPKAMASSLEQADVERKRRESAASKAAEEAATKMQARRDALQEQADTLEGALAKADTEDGKALIAQQLDDVRAELAALG